MENDCLILYYYSILSEFVIHMIKWLCMMAFRIDRNHFCIFVSWLFSTVQDSHKKCMTHSMNEWIDEICSACSCMKCNKNNFHTISHANAFYRSSCVWPLENTFIFIQVFAFKFFGVIYCWLSCKLLYEI